MQIENGRLVMGRRSCSRCTQGKVPGEKRCQICEGSGRGKRGKLRGCQACFGSGSMPDFDSKVTCPQCLGSYASHEAEDIYDYIPDTIWESLKFCVYRIQKGMSFNEQHIGAGCVFSCTDYGIAWGQGDEEVIDKVRKHHSHQACKIAKEDGSLCSFVVITVMPNGYSVRAAWSDQVSLAR